MPDALEVGKVYRLRQGRGDRSRGFKLLDEVSATGLAWFRVVRPGGVSRSRQYWSVVVFKRKVDGGPYGLESVPFEDLGEKR